MVQREKLCKECGMYFYYDDGVDPPGIGVSGNRSYIATQNTQEAIKGYCPRCIDPHFVPGESYDKAEVLHFFREHLKEHEIDTTLLSDDIIVEMLKEFPRAYSIYNSNGSYKTFSIYPGTIFQGTNGLFEIGPLDFHQYDWRVSYRRVIKCCRCNNTTIYHKNETLEFYLGFLEKKCSVCDPHKRNTEHLNRNGRVPSPLSERAMAKSLNMSRNEYRRRVRNHEELKPIPHLPIGFRIRNLEIVEAYWDEHPDSYAPKYKLQCVKCKQFFICLQKAIDKQYHAC